MQENKNGLDLLYLISCALHDATPQTCHVEQMELEAVYRLAKHHTLQAISFSALERCERLPATDEKTLAAWRSIREKILYKNLMMDFEREKLFAFFEENGIRYMSMKGLVLLKLYPKMGWRYLADNDILFDEKYRRQVCDYFKAQGYSVSSYNKGVHDVYFKEPYYNFEMHVSFFAKNYSDPGVQILADHYRDSWNWAKRDGEGFSYHLSDEDFYLHSIIAHAFKHARHGGTGLRTLVDIYVYLTQKGSSLDRNYINGQLEQLQLVEFEKDVRRLAFSLFEKPEYPLGLTDKQTEQLLFFISSGAYGSLTANIASQIAASFDGKITLWNKIKYAFGRIFPNMDYYKEYEPFFYKYKIFIPAFVIWRIFRSIFIKGSMKTEFKALKNIKTDRSK